MNHLKHLQIAFLFAPYVTPIPLGWPTSEDILSKVAQQPQARLVKPKENIKRNRKRSKWPTFETTKIKTFLFFFMIFKEFFFVILSQSFVFGSCFLSFNQTIQSASGLKPSGRLWKSFWRSLWTWRPNPWASASGSLGAVSYTPWNGLKKMWYHWQLDFRPF